MPTRYNSNVYVPLLLHCAQRLSTEAATAWQTNAVTGRAWQRAVMTYSRSNPKTPLDITHILHGLFRECHRRGVSVNPADDTAFSKIPRHLRNVPMQLCHIVQFVHLPDGYIPPSTQEALLIAFSGDTGLQCVADLAAACQPADCRSNGIMQLSFILDETRPPASSIIQPDPAQSSRCRGATPMTGDVPDGIP